MTLMISYFSAMTSPGENGMTSGTPTAGLAAGVACEPSGSAAASACEPSLDGCAFASMDLLLKDLEICSYAQTSVAETAKLIHRDQQKPRRYLQWRRLATLRTSRSLALECSIARALQKSTADGPDKYTKKAGAMKCSRSMYV